MVLQPAEAGNSMVEPPHPVGACHHGNDGVQYQAQDLPGLKQRETPVPSVKHPQQQQREFFIEFTRTEIASMISKSSPVPAM